MTSLLLSFGGYFLVLGLLCWWAFRRTHSLPGYVLGDRQLGQWVTALSAQASDMSGWLLMGLPGLAYTSGSRSVWLATGLLTGTYLNWRYVARPLRVTTESLDDSLTLPDYFTRRFDDQTGLLRILSALVILVFFTVYTASGMVAGARLFRTVFGIPYFVALLVGGIAIGLYTLAGGFLAVSWSDALQGSLMFFALVVVAGWGMFTASGGGGPTGFTALLSTRSGTNAGSGLGWVAILSSLGWGLGYFGQPHILARFMAIESPDRLPTARRIAVGWVTVCLLAAVLVGMLGTVHLPGQLSGARSERVFLLLAESFFPPLVAGVVLAGVLSAVMSTADSQLLVASSAVAEDFYRGLIEPSASDRRLLWVGRGAVIAIGLAALYLAWDPDRRVLTLVEYAWAGFGAAFGPVLLLSLYWDRVDARAGLTGMVVGGVTVLLWELPSGGIFELYELVPGFVLSSLSILVMTLVHSPSKTPS